MKEQIESLPQLINEEQKLYGLHFKDFPNLYKDMFKDGRPSRFTSRTSISNTEILFNSNVNTFKNLNIEFNDSKKKSLYQRIAWQIYHLI